MSHPAEFSPHKPSTKPTFTTWLKRSFSEPRPFDAQRLRDKYKDSKKWFADLLYDIERDPNWPKYARNRGNFLKALIKANATKDAHDAFALAWVRYEEYLENHDY
jgi:hypothetical protein